MARRRSGKRRGSVVGTLVFAAALLVMWAASRLGLVSWGGSGEDRVDLSASLPDAGIFVSYIDVGQGDSAFVSCGDDTLLIDAGVSSEGETVVDYLRSLGVTELDYVVCTHAHEDHCGGLDDVIEAFNIGTLFAPYTEFDASGAFTRFEDTAADKGLYVTVPELGAEFTLGGAVFLLLGIHIPQPVDKAITDISKISTPLALMLLGGSFQFSQIRGNVRQLVFSVASKLILVPALALPFAVLFGFRGVELTTIMSMLIPPTAVSSYTMADQMGGDGQLAAQIVVFGSAFSVITIFLWVFILRQLGLI